MGLLEDILRRIVSRKYICSQCGAPMEFESENEDILVCTRCGHSIDSEFYGQEEKTYEDLYPLLDEDDDEDDDEDEDDECSGELYEEVYNELSHDD